MKLGILGTGLIVHEVLPMLDILHLEKLYILGTEHSVEKTQKLCKTYRMDGCFFNYDEMLDADIDTVYIACLLYTSRHISPESNLRSG